MQAYTYSIVLIFTVFICFIASFDKRLQFNKYFLPIIAAAVTVAIPFIIWDIWFTARGVWWFDYSYTLGRSIAGLPLEEWLFFIFIPFSCVFTYYCVDKYYSLSWLEGLNNVVAFVSIIVCALIALLHHDKIYTFITAILVLSSMIFFHLIVRIKWLSKASLVFTFLMLGFFPVNGVLTGTGLESPIVNYNSADFLNIRIVTIPIEDAV